MQQTDRITDTTCTTGQETEKKLKTVTQLKTNHGDRHKTTY